MRINRARARWFAFSASAVGTLVVLVRCSSVDPSIGSSTGAVISSPYDAGGTIDPVEQEPSAVWNTAANPFGQAVPQLVVGYNDESASEGLLGKAISPDGITFTKCNILAACNGSLDVSRVGSVKTFLRHHTVVADGFGDVVYVTLADTDGDTSNAESVVALLSTDSGTTFSAAFPVNADSCSNGKQDMPHAAFDYTTNPPTLWIVWRHNGSGGSFGGCIRRFFINTSSGTPLITPLDQALDVVGMDRDALIGGSQGGLEVQAGDGVVTVVYANSDENDNCPTTEHHGVGWGSVATFDNGQDWVDHARMFHTDNWHSCLSGSAAMTIQNSIRSFDFVRTPTGIEYVAIADTPQTIRLFMNAAAGTKGWETPLNTVNPWFEFCPGTNTTPGDPTSPTRNWIPFEDGPCASALFQTPSNLRLMQPTIASDGDDQIAVGFYLFDLALPNFVQVAQLNGNPLLPGSPFNFTTPAALGGTVAPSAITTTEQTAVQPFGAYFNMIPREYAAGGGLITPGCSGEGDFMSLFVEASDAGTSQIGVRGIRPVN